MSDLHAGRLLDALMAKDVLLVPMPALYEAPPKYSSNLVHSSGVWYWHHGDAYWYAMPYSTDITAAWRIVEQVDTRNNVAKELGVRTFTLNRYADGSYWAAFFKGGATAPTAPLAICRAALRGVEAR